jgi:hypothetical protein
MEVTGIAYQMISQTKLVPHLRPRLVKRDEGKASIKGMPTSWPSRDEFNGGNPASYVLLPNFVNQE